MSVISPLPIATRSSPDEYSGSRNTPASPVRHQRSRPSKTLVAPWLYFFMTRKSLIRSASSATTAAHWGSCSRSHALALASVLNSSKLWNAGSATIPTLVAPEASRISQTQYPSPIRWLVDIARSPSTRRPCQSGSSLHRPTSISVAIRNHAALQWCSLACLRSSCRGSSRLRPDASTTQRAVVVRDRVAVLVRRSCADASSVPNSTDRTRPRAMSTPVGQAASVQLVLQPAAVDLVGHLRHERGATEFHPLRDVGVPLVGEEHPQAHLADVRGAQVVAQTQTIPQVVRRHLDGRLADRVGDLRHRVGVGLDHQDPRGRAPTA